MSQLELSSQTVPILQKSEGRSAGWIGNLLFNLYRIPYGRVRNWILFMVEKLEGGQDYSLTLRRIFAHYHKVTIGVYSRGGCFAPDTLRPNTIVGRYCSIAHGVWASLNHPMNLKSSHPFFYDPKLGYVKGNNIRRSPLTIGNDVWIGQNALIMPSVNSIGDGVVIGAGAVVNKNIPPYAVVVGNPGQIVRFRFSKEIINELIESRWWDRSIEELLPELDSFQHPLVGEEVR